jgi:hypothetical protein
LGVAALLTALLAACGSDTESVGADAGSSAGTGSTSSGGGAGGSGGNAGGAAGAAGASSGGAPSGGAAGTGGSGATGGAGAGGGAGSGGAGGSGGGFTADGCFKWSGDGALQSAVNAHACVEVQPGTYTLTSGVVMPPGHTLRGVSAAQSVLKASQSQWTFHCCDSMISEGAGSEQNPFKVQKLTLDGAGVATYNVCCRGYVVDDSVLRRSRCSAIGAAGTNVTAKNNQMLESAQPTNVPGKGTVSCATGGFGGVAEGAAIYSEAKAASLGTVIDGNVIKQSFGPALDVNGAWGGVFKNNTVAENTAWAAVSLYGASNWLIENNQISHPANQPPQPYHPYCATGPAGGHSAGIFLCQDTDVSNLVTNGNKIVGNKSSSFYGILSVGADELKPYFAPRNNTFQNNDVFGSSYGCADDFKPGQWQSDGNVWSGNNCAGSPNTGPGYF